MIKLFNLIDAIRYRLQHDHWCPHTERGTWLIGDGGRFKYRACRGCGRWETA